MPATIACLVVLLVPQEALAQQDPSFSHYWAMESSFCPAAVGKQELLNVTAAYNMALAGFEHNPKTMYIAADMPFALFGTKHGAGLELLNDQIGLFRHQRLSLQYAFKQPLFGGVLSVGVRGGLMSENFDGSDLVINDPGDLTLSSSQIQGTGFDLGAGLYYQWRGWYLGASAQHLTAPTILLGETNEINIARSYYVTAGGNIRLRNPLLSVQPSLLARTDGVGWRTDATCRLTYRYDGKMFYGGLGYSPTNSVTLYLGALFHGVVFGYSYEAYTHSVGLGSGSHELIVGYQTAIQIGKKGHNRHQSPRIL